MSEELYDHQKKILIKNPARSLLCWDTGTGKTRAGIELCRANAVVRTMVIVPKALKKNWQRNIAKYDNGGSALWIIKTKEEFRRDWETLPPVNAVLVDEAHYFSGMKSQMSKSLSKYLRKHKINFIWLLTATPYLSTPWNIYALAKHLGYNWSWIKFREKFFVDRYIGRRIVPAVKPGIEGEIASLVATIGDVVRLDECADIPEQVFDTEYFELNDEQKKLIEQTIEINPIVRFTKHHQIENGTLKSDGYTIDTMIRCDKNDRLLELCQENDKVIVVCRYNLQIDALFHSLKEAGKPIFVINGQVKDRDSVVAQAEAAEKAIILVNAACSEGYELPSFPLMVFASLSFSYKDYKQMIGRIQRLNKLKKNVYLHLVTSDGVDAAVYDAIMKKKDFDIEVYSKEHGAVPGEEFSDGF